MLFSDRFKIPIQGKTASSNLEIAVMHMKLFCFCFIYFPAATILQCHEKVSVCAHEWLRAFQQMAFCSEPSGGISPPSWGCYLTTHLLLWFALKETPLTLSPPHPAEANQHGSSPGQELLAVRIASGLVTRCHGESVMRHTVTGLFSFCSSVLSPSRDQKFLFFRNHYYQ